MGSDLEINKLVKSIEDKNNKLMGILENNYRIINEDVDIEKYIQIIDVNTNIINNIDIHSETLINKYRHQKDIDNLITKQQQIMTELIESQYTIIKTIKEDKAKTKGRIKQVHNKNKVLDNYKLNNIEPLFVNKDFK